MKIIQSILRQKQVSRKLALAFLMLSACFCLGSCKKFISIDPPITNINGEVVYEDDVTATRVLAGIYTELAQGKLSSEFINLPVVTGLSSDELSLFSGTDGSAASYYRNSLTAANVDEGLYPQWNTLYQVIFFANSAIEGLENSTKLTPKVKTQLLGEAKFIRAFCYFYLTNLYGDLPLVFSTDYQQNTLLSKSPQSVVYTKIIDDLLAAKSILSTDYLDANVTAVTTDKVRPTKWAASALLARVYLYTKDYVNAEAEASKIIGTGPYSIAAIGEVFKKNSTEAIWQLRPVVPGRNTEEAVFFVIPSTGPNAFSPVTLNPRFVNDFGEGDLRKTEWVGTVKAAGTDYYYPNKYKVYQNDQPLDEYSVVFRLSEQFLIRAEARINQPGKIETGIADINTIRTRARAPKTSILSDPLPPLALTLDKTQAMEALISERRFELFTEYGHRWLDLKRTGTVDAVMQLECPKKGGVWNSHQQLYPIPIAEIRKMPNVSQVLGY